MSSPWIYQTATELSKALSEGAVSSRELLEAAISRTQDVNPRINAVVAQDLERARKQADDADQARARGEIRGPLHGIPMTAKDTWEIPGMPCTAGAPIFRNHQPKTTAVALQQLINAGAIVYGKTNVPLFASDIQSYNRIYGTTNNPWNTAKTPGGSSGGAAAALAAGMTPIELGSDLAGSIRIPSHYCGVYGHKPTHGIIPLRGHIPGPPGTLGEPPLAVAGPMARSAEDLSLLLDLLVGPTPQMAPGWSVTLPAADAKPLNEYKVLLWTEDELCPVNREMLACYDKLEGSLKQAGVSVKRGHPGMSMAELYPVYMSLMGGLIGVSQPKRMRRMAGLMSALIRRFGHWLGTPKELGSFLAGADSRYADAMILKEQSLQQLERFIQVFNEVDVILMPPTATTAIDHLQKPDIPKRRVPLNGSSIGYMDLFIWISPGSLLGLPGTSAPVGMTESGLPCNIQILGAPYQDHQTIRFAELLAEVCGGFQIPPGFETGN